jgi:hypothetical protein
MRDNWDQPILLPAPPHRPVKQAGGPATQSAAAIRASADRLYMRGELARAAQLLVELQMRGSQA